MTKRVNLHYICPSCKKDYTAMTYTSFYSGLPKPAEFNKPITCPYCGAPYTRSNTSKKSRG